MSAAQPMGEAAAPLPLTDDLRVQGSPGERVSLPFPHLAYRVVASISAVLESSYRELLPCHRASRGFLLRTHSESFRGS